VNYFNLVKKYPSVILVAVSNFYPLVGVVFWGWQVRDIMATFLIESLVIGGFTVAKLLTVSEKMVSSRPPSRRDAVLAFMFVYGAFQIGYFVFLTFIFQITVGDWEKVWLICVPMAISHGFSFVSNYWMSERNTISIGRICLAPFLRVIPMQYAVLFGLGFFGIFGDKGGVMLMALMLVKAAVDVISHLYERKVFRAGMWEKVNHVTFRTGKEG
jgi:hypothetical protein